MIILEKKMSGALGWEPLPLYRLREDCGSDHLCGKKLIANNFAGIRKGDAK
jgi:hypothetical protein